MGKMKEAVEKKPEISKPQNGKSKVMRATAEQEKAVDSQLPATKPTTAGAVTSHDPTNVFATYGESASTRPIGEFLKFTKGDWFAGADNKIIKQGTKMIVQMYQFRTGWQRWEDQRPTDQESGLLIEGYRPPRRADLGDLDKERWEVDETTGLPRDPWQFFNSVPMSDGKLIYNFVTSSRGGIEALGDLCKIFGKVYRVEPNKLPIVALGFSGYWHSNRQFGFIKKPQFALTGWADRSKYDAVEAAHIEQSAQEPSDEEGAYADDGEDALV